MRNKGDYFTIPEDDHMITYWGGVVAIAQQINTQRGKQLLQLGRYVCITQMWEFKPLLYYIVAMVYNYTRHKIFRTIE